MDVLSEVLEALCLEAKAVERLAATHGQPIGADGEATLLVVVEGACALASSDGERELHLMVKDAAVLAHRPYRVMLPAGGTVGLIRCVFSWERGLRHPLVREFPPLLLLRADALTDETEFGRAAALLDAELVNARLGVKFSAQRLGEILFIEMLRKCQLLDPPPVFLAALSDSAVNAALARIHLEPGRAPRVGELAREAGISRAVFFERFHRLVGETPQRYARAWRLLRARRALLREAAPVQAVAAAAGYASRAGFSRAFQREFGHRPSVFRGG